MLHCSRKKADHITLSHYTYQHTGHQKFPYRLSVSWDAGEENDPLSLQGTPEYTCLTIGKPVNWQYISKVPNMTLRKQVLPYLFTDNSQFLMIYCQFLSISRREETDICNCQQPCQQSALPTEVLPLDEGAEIRRHVHYLPAQKNGYCPSEARGSGEGTSAVKISEPKTSGWIGKCASINKTADKQNETEKEKSTNK